MRCSEIVNKFLAANLLENLTVKKIENRPRINRVTAVSLVSPFFGTRCTLLSNSEKVTRQDNSRASSFGHSPVLSAEHFSLCGFLAWTADRMMLREREGCCKNGMARKGRGRTLRSRCGSSCNEAIAWTCGPQSQRGHYADRQREMSAS